MVYFRYNLKFVCIYCNLKICKGKINSAVMEINKLIVTVGYFNIPVSGAVMISRQKKLVKM